MSSSCRLQAVKGLHNSAYSSVHCIERFHFELWEVLKRESDSKTIENSYFPITDIIKRDNFPLALRGTTDHGTPYLFLLSVGEVAGTGGSTSYLSCSRGGWVGPPFQTVLPIQLFPACPSLVSSFRRDPIWQSEEGFLPTCLSASWNRDLCKQNRTHDWKHYLPSYYVGGKNPVGANFDGKYLQIKTPSSYF